MSKLFQVLAGTSDDYFNVGGVDFQAAPVTLLEYGEYLALPQNDLGSKAEYLADKLKRRIRGTKTSPDLITPDWVLENVPLPMLSVIEYVLLYGEMPDKDEKKAR